MEKEKKIWLSPDGLSLLERCPRCFWLKYKKGIKQPEGIVSRLPGRFDKVIKDYFEHFRGISKLPPLLEGKIEGSLQNPFKEIYYYSVSKNYGFLGKLDECLVLESGEHIPVDFKTSSTDPRKNDILPAYQRQMDAYSFLLERNNKKISNFAYLMFFYLQESSDLHNGFPILLHIYKVKTNPENVESKIYQAIEVLEGHIPYPSSQCQFCNWYDNIRNLNLDE